MARTLSLSWDTRLRLERERRRRQAEAAKAPKPVSTAADQRTAAALTFSDWLPEVSPQWTWHWPHLVYQRGILERALEGFERRRLDPTYRGDEPRYVLIISPPRHGKTEQNTIRFGSYLLERLPVVRLLVAGHTQGLASKFSRAIRKIVRRRGVAMSPDKVAAVREWETSEGGGLRAVGVGVGISGEGADVILIDDPIKSRKQAESIRYREELWDWFKDDVWNRRNNPANALVFVTMTTWHSDDLAGRIRNDPELGPLFTVVHLPALAEAADPTAQPPIPPDPLGRAPGEALCPARMTREELESLRRFEGEYSFSALFQGRPTPRSGNMFPRGKVAIVDGPAPAGTRWARGWDKAGTREERGKFSAGVKVGIGPDGYVYLADIRRGRWEASDREAEIKATAQADGFDVPIRIEQEPGSGGKQSAQGTVANLGGYQIGTEPSVVNKEARAQPFSSQWKAGLVRIVRGPNVQAYLQELENFPSGTFSDQVDATTIAYNWLTQNAVTFSQVRVRTS